VIPSQNQREITFFAPDKELKTEPDIFETEFSYVRILMWVKGKILESHLWDFDLVKGPQTKDS